MHLDLTDPSSPGAATDLLLFDNNGNLVPLASGNGGRTESLVSFTVPSGEAGNWTARAETLDSAYSYDLSVYGETGSAAFGPSSGTMTTPEPASVSMLLLGLSGCALFLRRR